MSREPNSPQPPQDAQETPPRRKYAAPHLKLLGSVRDLTLGSPGMFVDAVTGKMAMAM